MQLTLFFDASSTGGFFSTPSTAPHIILRLKDGMDTSEPSTNGTAAANLHRLASLLGDAAYAQRATQTLACFESEIMQHPWLYASFMPSVVACRLGVRGVVVAGDGARRSQRVKAFEQAPRGALGSLACLGGIGGWLRTRNEELRALGLGPSGTGGGGTRVLVCEGGVCVEEGEEAPAHVNGNGIVNGVAGGAVNGGGFGVGELGGALPALEREMR